LWKKFSKTEKWTNLFLFEFLFVCLFFFVSLDNCNVGNTTYFHGEIFKIDCRTQCVCEVRKSILAFVSNTSVNCPLQSFARPFFFLFHHFECAEPHIHQHFKKFAILQNCIIWKTNKTIIHDIASFYQPIVYAFIKFC
jgi:hypothetical protein